jgi:DNA-binding IclR family transcriptional regulator
MWTAVLDNADVTLYPQPVTVAPDSVGRPEQARAARSASAGVHATLRILDLLAARSPLQLSELARELSVAKSTIHRICTVLVDRGWAVRDSEGRYSLGIRALRLGSRANELPIVTAFRTAAATFLNHVDETITLAVLDGDESLYVAMEETSQPIRYVTHVGRKTPAYASASGRVVLAYQPRSTVDALFAGRPLITPTKRRLGGIAELGAILDEVARQGYAENWEDTAPGLYAASVPIINAAGVPLAALTTLVPVSRVSGERREAIVAALREAGAELSELVAWLPAFGARSE